MGSSYGLIVAIIVAVVGLAAEAIYQVVSKDKKLSRIVFIPLAAGVLGFITEKIIEIDLKTEQIEELSHSMVFLDAANEVQETKANTALRSLLDDEMGFIKERLRQISQGELKLRREEVIPRWETLIRHSKTSIWATNIVTYDDWEEFSPSAGDAVNREAVNRKVKVRRIFIFDPKDPSYTSGLLALAKRHKKMGIDVRIMEKQWIVSSPFVSDYYRDLGTLDIVIYDDQCVLLTMVDQAYRIVSADVVTNPHRFQRAKEFYEKLWEEGRTIEQYMQK